MMKAAFVSLISAVLYAQLVATHGVVVQLTIDGKSYEGNTPFTNAEPSKDSPIRRLADVGPVTDVNDPQLSCGVGSAKASMVVDAMPGSKVSAQWSEGWEHPMGPILFYMASCGSTSCDQFDPSGAKWFKISQQGLRENSDSSWYMEDIVNHSPAETTLPENLAPGGYLIRHELINLEIATAIGGAEYYPSCFQVKIGGNGNGVPNATVSFPGAYRADDPGLYVPTIFDNVKGFVYQFPGGPVAEFSGGGDSAPAPSPSPTDDDEGTPTQTSTDESSTEDAGAPATSMPATPSTSMDATPSSMAASSPTPSSTGDVSSSMAMPAPSTAAPSPTNVETTAPSSAAVPGPSPTETFWVYVPPTSSTVAAMSSDAANMKKRSDRFSGGALPNGRMLAAMRQH